MSEIDLGNTQTIRFNEENAIIGLDKKFLKLNDEKPIEFHVKITENGKIVLESELLPKLSNTGFDKFVKD